MGALSIGLLILAAGAPWRAGVELGAPDWLEVGLSAQLRYEHLGAQFRRGFPADDDRALSSRILLGVRAGLPDAGVVMELQDSRLFFADDDAPVFTGLANPLELLQAHLHLRLDGLPAGGTLELKAGRMTMNVGSRRLVARNRFRNAINGFSGLDLRAVGRAGDVVRLFAVMPVSRRPQDAEGLLGGRVELDREATGTLFWGLRGGARPLIGDVRTELYVFGLHESDRPELPTRNRNFLSIGTRVLRPPARGRVDFELEGVMQAGTSRATANPEDLLDLDHFAGFVHLGAGVTAELPFSPRVAVLYDHVTGDQDPNDGRNGAFDQLFGAQRFEYGPTNLWAFLGRNNLRSPSVRLELQEAGLWEAFFAWRAGWRDQLGDGWRTAERRLGAELAGRFIGHQLEAGVRWAAIPGNFDLDLGVARAWLGELAAGEPAREPLYGYLQANLRI